VVEAPSGKEALEALRKHSVDLVFLDLMMPEMDGLTFLALKKDDPRVSGIPVIVCSALGEKETLARAQELGAVNYILKPFTVNSVEEKLRKAFLALEG
jgi:CheY-like chemotaxis protein